eukprot:GSChrysophyteH1.ASY1.ANO1.3137.1 assembled CDS
MDIDEEFYGDDIVDNIEVVRKEEPGIQRPKSAYQYHAQLRSPHIKAQLLAEGKNATMGIVVQTVAGIWRGLSPEEKQEYVDMATKDRERYDRECAERDAVVRAEQEARRKKNNVTGFSMEKREAAPKRKREESDASKKDKARRRKERKEELEAVDASMKDIKASRMEQVEARLKYLLSQSDIFSHFGAGTKKMKDTLQSSVRVSNEDERNLIAEEADDDLLQQPSIITGGLLRPYQLEGLNWVIRLIENGINGILADEMGLGKTLQSISVIAYLRQYQNINGPHLIMVPKSTLSNWMGEFARFCPEIRVLRFHGSKAERDEDWDVLVTTYEVMNLEKHSLMKIGWRFLIVDEAHRLKNEASQFAQNIRLLETQHRLLLTGTPLQNNLHELWALLNFLLPDVIILQLHKLLRPFMLRRLKVDVEKALPPKSETILFIGLSEQQKQVYKQILLRDIDVINANAKEKREVSGRTAILNIVMQLRKCCNHPYLFPGTEDRSLNPLGDHLYKSCGKMVLLHKLLERLFARKNRVLIFSQMTRMLDILEDYLYSQGYNYCRIDGNTSYEDREDRIADFNSPNSNKFIFLLSTRAGGLGINLQTADTVILYDSDWNPQADLQAQDRAHRIGQTKPVHVFRLVTEDTIEVKVVERAQQKLKLDAMVVQQGRLQDNQKKMTKTELLDTLRFGADKVFRSTGSDITDADIDLILQEGKRKTEEMNSSLTTNDKGDLYDFSLDGNMHCQEFEGVNYSDEDFNSLTLAALLEPVAKRERKAVIEYETAENEVVHHTRKRFKSPKQIRMPRMEDWHFFKKDRIAEIFEEERKSWDACVEKLEIPAFVNGRLPLLPSELENEKRQLLSSGFGDWTRVQFNSFIKGSAKYGRNEFSKIAKEVWDRMLKQIEKGEARIEEVEKLSSTTARLVSNHGNAWENIPVLRDVSTQYVRTFSKEEDRALLCLVHMYGYGAWDQIRSAVRNSELFRFNYFMQSCSEDAFAKRCEVLMRAAQRELTEIEMKKAEDKESDNRTVQLGIDAVSKLNGSQYAQARARSIKLSNETFALTQNEQGVAVETAAQIAQRVANASLGVQSNASSTSTRTYKASGRPSAKNVPEGIVPGLAKLLVASQSMGISGVVAQFVAKHPTISKRQIELKIAEIAVKEKHEKDHTKVWHIRPEHNHWLQKEDFVETEESKQHELNRAEKAEKEMQKKLQQKLAKPRSPFQVFANENWKAFLSRSKKKNAEHVKATLVRAWDSLGDVLRAQFAKISAEEYDRFEKAEAKAAAAVLMTEVAPASAPAPAPASAPAPAATREFTEMEVATAAAVLMTEVAPASAPAPAPASAPAPAATREFTEMEVATAAPELP